MARLLSNKINEIFWCDHIDEDLSWGPHIDATKRKLYYAISTLSRIKETVPEFLHKDL